MNSTNYSFTIPLDKYSPLNWLDYSARISTLVVHLIYILLVVIYKEFRLRSLLYLHHVNIVSLLICLHYVFYIGSIQPSFSSNQVRTLLYFLLTRKKQYSSFLSKKLNQILCYTSEIFWIVLKFLRLYSLLILTIYRYISVFKLQFLSKLNKNSNLMIASIFSVWLFSFVMAFSFKYIFSTTYAPNMLCYDGYSEDWIKSMLFFVAIFVVCYLIPSVLVIFFYRKIMKKLKAMSDHLNQDSMVVNQNSSASSQTRDPHSQSRARRNQVDAIFQVTSGKIELPNILYKFRQNKNKKIKRFAKQTIILNGLILFASFFSFLCDVSVTMSTNAYLDSMSQNLQKLVPIFRTIFLCILSAIPIFSVLYSQIISISMKSLTLKIKNTSIFSATKFNNSSMKSAV